MNADWLSMHIITLALWHRDSCPLRSIHFKVFLPRNIYIQLSSTVHSSSSSGVLQPVFKDLICCVNILPFWFIIGQVELFLFISLVLFAHIESFSVFNMQDFSWQKVIKQERTRPLRCNMITQSFTISMFPISSLFPFFTFSLFPFALFHFFHFFHFSTI